MGFAAIAAIAMDALRETWEEFEEAIDLAVFLRVRIEEDRKRARRADGVAAEIRAAALRRDMGRRFALCNLDELRVIDVQLTRLELGREQYGPLDLSRYRDWHKELAEEHVDAAFYRACAILVEREERARAALGSEPS